MESRFEKVLERISGEPGQAPFRHRILNLLVFLGLFQAGYFLVSDLVVGQPPVFYAFDGAMLLFFGWLYHEVRHRCRYSPGCHLFAVAGVVLPQFNLWVNSGISGPGLLVILAILVALNFLHSGRSGVLYTVVGATLTLVSLSVQLVHPDWVLSYSRPESQLMDISATFLLCLVLLVFIAKRVMRFHEELLQSAQRLRESAAQSERMAVLGQMVANMGHEIGSPVGVMGSSLSLTREWWSQELPRFPELWGVLTPEQRDALWHLIRRGLEVVSPSPDTRTVRRRREVLAAETGDPGMAEDLSGLDIETWDPRWEPLRVDEAGRSAWEFAVRLLTLDRSNRLASRAHDRIQRLVAALGAYSRSGSPEDSPVPTQVFEGLDTVLTLYASAHKGGLEIQREYREVPPVLARPDELIQVWTNLVQNALQAMDYRGTLTVGVRSEGAMVIVTIDDTGPGVPEGDRERVFQLFYTTKKAGAGTGLGLGIAQRIVVSHGGTIEAGEAPGGGARFTVRLPAAPTHA